MRISQSIDTSIGKIVMRELTPSNIIQMKDQMVAIQDALSEKSEKQILLEDQLAVLEKVNKPTNADKLKEESTRNLLAKEAHQQGGVNNLKLLQDVPGMVETMSGDCLEIVGSTEGISSLGFSELSELWTLFKEVNASFLGVVPVHLMAQNLVRSFQSNLLQESQLPEEKSNG